jgi:hypothetical protein
MEPQEQARYIGDAWERLQKQPRRRVSFHVVDPDGTIRDFMLGAHAPALTEADVAAIHALWLDATKEGAITDLHHHEVVTIALARLADEMNGGGRRETFERMRAFRRQQPRDAPTETVSR